MLLSLVDLRRPWLRCHLVISLIYTLAFFAQNRARGNEQSFQKQWVIKPNHIKRPLKRHLKTPISRKTDVIEPET